jgi:hypothetical protein
MPIQFCCTSCGQPIEVDAEHAGKTAACPYCQHVISVPTESTYHPDAAVTARPAATPLPASGYGRELSGPPSPVAGPPPQPPTAWPGSEASLEPSPRQRAARTFGNYALVCTGIAVALFAATFAGSLALLLKHGAPGRNSPSLQDIMKQMEGTPSMAWVSTASYAMLLFALVGVGLSISSLVQDRRGNWRAIVSLIGSGALLLCNCGGAVVASLMGVGAPPA